MAHAIRYSNKDASYLSKEHFCPDCNKKLTVVKVSKVINSSSEENKDMPKMFSKTIVGGRGVKFRSYTPVGDIKYIWKELECENCCRRFTAEEMKKIECATITDKQERSPEEIKRIKRNKLLFNTILPIAILALIAIIRYFVLKW